jgi:hypothetical protein
MAFPIERKAVKAQANPNKQLLQDVFAGLAEARITACTGRRGRRRPWRLLKSEEGKLARQQQARQPQRNRRNVGYRQQHEAKRTEERIQSVHDALARLQPATLAKLADRCPNLIGFIVKAGAKLVGHDAGPVRPPLTDLKPEEMDQLATLIAAQGAQ